MSLFLQRSLVLFVLFPAGSLLYAQDAKPFYYTGYQAYTEKEGYTMLENPTLMTQDKKGLLWIGGGNGLFSFDGTHFKHYRNNRYDSTSLPRNAVSFNYQDSHEQYWVAVYNHGLYRFEPRNGTFARFRYSNEDQFNIHAYNMHIPLETKKGELWFSLRFFGLARWDEVQNKMIPYKICKGARCDSMQSNITVFSIAEDPDDQTLWLASSEGLVHFFPDSGKFIFTNASSEIMAGSVRIFFDRQKRLWTGTWGEGIKLFDRGTKQFTTYKWSNASSGTRNICCGIGQVNDRYLWVGTVDYGLLRFDMEKKSFQQVSGTDDNPLQFSSDDFFQNKDGVCWFANLEKLYRIHPDENKFVFHSLKSVTGKRPVSSLLYSFLKTDSLLYTGVFYYGYLVAYNEAGQMASLIDPKESSNIWCLSKDKQGLIWVGTTTGIYTLKPGGSQLRKLESKSLHSLSGFAAYKILHDDDGSKWIASSDGLGHYFPGQDSIAWIFQTPEQNLPKVRVNTVYESKDGNIWFGTNIHGLACYQRRTGKIIFFNKKRVSHYPEEYCESIAETPDGKILFVGDNSGLCVLSDPFTDKEDIRTYNSSDGFPFDKAFKIFSDKEGRYWLFTTNGLCLLDIVRMKVSRHFTKEQGLYQSLVDCNPYQDDEGNIYLGYAHAFQVFDPGKLLRSAPEKGTIYLSSVKINGNELESGVQSIQSLQLNYDQTNFSFDFTFLTSAHTAGYNYAYKLSRIDKDWVYTGTKASGQYSKLPPGNYQLRIRAINGNGTWVSDEFVLPIAVSRPWYGSWWFYALLALTTLLIIMALFRYRIAQIKKQNVLRTQFSKKINEIELKALRAQMNPHFIFNCLSSINRYIVKSDHKTASNYLTKFSKLMRLILDNSTSDTITLDREIQTLQLYIDMEALRFDHAFTYEIDSHDILQPDSIIIPSLLLQPYIENAIWHGLLNKSEGEGKIWIRFKQPSLTLLHVQIEDNGVGRKKAKELSGHEAVRKKSYGIQISKERLQLINELYNIEGKVQIADLDKDGEPCGTRVDVMIPLRKE